MIYTVTFNPALDYVIQVKGFSLGEVNRTTEEHIFCGGKGINVSTILARLGYASVALGFVAGFTGDEIEREAQRRGFDSQFIHVEKGLSRINVKLKSEEETEINGMGPEITQGDVQQLMERLGKLEEGDVLVLSGSIPPSIDDKIYEMIMEQLQGKGIRIVVDATKDLLMNVVPYHPFLIKPNNHELGEMFGVVLETEDDIISYGKKLQEMGAENVLVSMAGDGAILIAADGNIYKRKPPKGVVKNSVGAGDSMVAGFLAGYMNVEDMRMTDTKTADTKIADTMVENAMSAVYEEALKMGTAAGSASAFSDDLATETQIKELYEQLS